MNDNITPIRIQEVIISSYPDLLKANYCKVVDITVIPNESCHCTLVLGRIVDNMFSMVFTRNVEMTEEQYKIWGTDDNYAINTFLNNANLVRI